MRYVNCHTKRVYAMIASMPNMMWNFVWFAIKKYKGGLCKGCNKKQGNEIKTKKCMDCNINQAKCKGGLCGVCYKKQGCDGMK